MSEQLIDLIKNLDPQLIKQIEAAAELGIKKDKVQLYELLVKNNASFSYEKVDELVERHENNRIDINWNKNEFIYRIVISKRKKKVEKIDGRRKLSSATTNGDDNGIKKQATGS